MAAKRYCATALDGRHHLHLIEADVAGIGAAPCRPVGAEVGGEAVAQRVQRHRLLDPGRVGRLVKQTAQLAGGHRLARSVAGK